MKSEGDSRPRADEVRAALDRIIATPHFRASPQLASFLRFVVEAALSGGSDRIKGYTIAVEALGRDTDFDPQADPIVRVEAGRLRRALDRYYANGGTDDPIAIELPRGSYVPIFRHRAIKQHAFRFSPAIRDAMTVVWPRVRKHAIALTALIAGVAVLAGLSVAYFGPVGVREAALPGAAAVYGSELRPRSIYVGPVIYVEPVATIGVPVPPTISALSLRDRLRDAFARFDEITVLAELPALASADVSAASIPISADYRFASTLEYHSDGAISLTFRLLDSADGTIVWSKSYDHLVVGDDPRKTKYPIVNEIARTLLQPAGVLHARERIKRSTANNTDERYRCLLDAIEYMRSFNPALHSNARDCLEQAIATDPGFLSGYLALARVFLREYQFGLGVRPGDPPALDRAFALATRAAELKPNSARVQFVLSSILAARGDLAAARAAGERSIALNPNDAVVLFNYGTLLVLTGEIEKGVAIVHQIVAESPVRPPRIEFTLFLAAYLSGDVQNASFYASQLTNPTFVLGHLARALAAVRSGDLDAARTAAEQLVALQPAWRDDPRGELRKFFPLPAMIDQISDDLVRVGLGVALNAVTEASGVAKPRSSAELAPVLPPDKADLQLRPGSGMPTIKVEPFTATDELRPVSTDVLRDEVVNALRRFETIDIASEESSRPVDYRLAATLQFRDRRVATITYRLLDGRDGTVVWTRRFDDVAVADDAAVDRKVVLREVVTTLALPTGVIHSRAREKDSALEDRRYRCFLKDTEFWIRFDTDSRVRARTCFEEMTDNTFVVGFAALARIYLVEHRINLGTGIVDRPGLERAVRMANRAVELAPNSAMAQIALMEVRFLRHEVDAGYAAGARAIELNPFDIDAFALYGARLIGRGDFEKGQALLREAADATLPRPPLIEFDLFLGAYLTGDWPNAILHANRISGDSFAPGLVARAITAAAAGDRAGVESSIQRLVAMNPDWARDPRRLLANQFLSPLLIDRLAHGLTEAGLHDAIDEANAGSGALPRRRSRPGLRRPARRSPRS